MVTVAAQGDNPKLTVLYQVLQIVVLAHMNGTMGSATHAPLTRDTGSPEDCVSDAVTKLQFKLDSCEINDLPRETSFQEMRSLMVSTSPAPLKNCHDRTRRPNMRFQQVLTNDDVKSFLMNLYKLQSAKLT